ncbi:uncharacterized protein [Ptychodera flava]|uniref:uncharacterized protein n=1 Tax=Ptychodera flava TaxID=63121 RepID=UPI00396A98D8
MFRPSQVVAGNQNDDLSITMTRDVTKERMYSGAIYQTNPDVTEGGKYSIDIIAASGDLSAITSVVFWDGPAGIAGDYDAPLLRKEWFDDDREYDDCALCCNTNTTLEGDARCLCNCTEYFDQLRMSTAPPETTRMTTSEAPQTTTVPWEIENEVPPDNTFQGDPDLKLMSHQSMGFQLHPAIEVDGEIKHFIAVWFRYQNESTEPENVFIEQLDFDPSEAWHSYMMEITPIKGELSVQLFIDGRSVVYMSGLVPFSENTQFTILVRNSNGNVASFDDVFNPPSTKASFRNIRFPPSSDALCRFGEPFRSGDNPIIAFYAGIGSGKLMDDVVPFFEVSRPCIPCNSPCVSGTCDKQCSTTEAKRHLVRIDNIELSTNRTVEEDGQLQVVPAVYYITIKAVTGSGRYVIASSDGVYVDDTPPIFDYLYHVDKAWSEDEPVTFQGSNSTIAVRWSAYDIGSQVYEFKWAIGTTPNGTDIQDFVSVGLDNFVYNEELEGALEDRKTYYVTVHATNNAGLSTVAITSGVTLILTPPDVSNSNITIRCGNSSIAASDLCGDQSGTGLTWDEVDDDSIEAYYFSIGSTEDTDDVFPMFQVGYNESGTVEIMNGAIHIGGEKIANISDVRTLSDGSQRDESPDDAVYKSRFHMEPGRTLVSKITVCNKGHLCKKMAVSKTTITRNGDLIGKPGNDSRIEMTLVSHEAGPHSDVSINVLSETQPGEDTVTLTAGILTAEDINAEYTSDASVDFKPFIVNPEKTMDKTDRFLRKRIEDIIGQTFYITTVESVTLKEPMNITMGFNVSLFDGDDIEGEPRLLYWQTGTQQWKDASHTCKDTFGEYKYDWNDGILSVKVCSTKVDTSTQRNRRSGTGDMFSGPNQFTVARVGPFVNSPPRITSASKLWMLEDGGTLRYRLTYTDDDGDTATFSVEPNSPETGEEVKVSKEGGFRYTPCLDCYGIHDITVSAVEERYDDFEALSTTRVLSVDVRGQNDNPQLVISVDHKSALHGDDFKVTFTIEQRSADDHSYRGLEAVVGAFDPDTADKLTLLFDGPRHGKFEHKTQHRQINFIDADCSDIANITEDHLTIDTPETPVVVHPCGLVTPHHRDRLAWVFSAVRYMPPVEYIGEDSFKINAVDQEGAHSEVATISVYVLANPCLNGGSCRGPQSDPDCLSKERSNGFDGYSCICPPGFTGEFCGSTTNKCQPNPCPYNFTCVDMVDAHSCHCENIDWPCGGKVSASNAAIIASICGVGALVIVGMMIAWRRLKRQKKKMNTVAPSPSDITHEYTQPRSDKRTDTSRDSTPDVEPSDVNDNVTDSEVGKAEPVTKDKDEDAPQVIELADMPVTARKEDKSKGRSFDDKDGDPVPIIAQRFGFVSRPNAPRMAWMHGNNGSRTRADDNEQIGPHCSETEA